MTELIYLQDSNVFETAATIVGRGSDYRGVYLILDRTPFYPQGGGQPADQGTIRLEGELKKVTDVRKVEGEIRHYLEEYLSNFSSEVELVVDRDRRLLNTRYHTAGHLVAAIAEKFSSQIKATKGHQFPGEAYIEFAGMLEDEKSFKEELQALVNEITKTTTTVEVLEGKPLRKCQIMGFPPVPCGGTHVRDLSQIGPVTIKKCRSKKSKTKISYDLEEM